MAEILIIDDDESMCYALSRMAVRHSHSASCAGTLAHGLEILSTRPFDVVFLDVKMPDGNGIEALPRVQSIASHPEVIIITGYGEPDGAELAMKFGAWSYIEKGTSIKDISLSLLRALEYRQEKQARSRAPLVVFQRDGIIGSSAGIRECLDLIAQAAQSDAGVLLAGETGTGKELFARAIHLNGPRAAKEFVVVDCAALPESLIESQLFGHERGAFTGADKSRKGLIMQAHGGTLFLDEVGELPMSLQKAFLRVLQEHRFRPLGSGQELESDFRVVAASNRDLDSMVKDGQFRADLLFRLRSFTICLPPLRERPEDIPELTRYQMDRICRHYGLALKGVSPEFMETLIAYSWPGNVRELVNALDRAISAARFDPTLYAKHLPSEIRASVARAMVSREQPAEAERVMSLDGPLPSLGDFRERICEQAERQYLSELLARSRGTVKDACKTAGISQSRLYALLQKHGIPKVR